MVELKDQIVDTFWITLSTDETKIGYGLAPVGSIVQSGLDSIETFTEEQPWHDRLVELGVPEDEIVY